MWDFYTSLHLSLRLDDDDQDCPQFLVIRDQRLLGVTTLARELGRQKPFSHLLQFSEKSNLVRQHTDHANVWVRFLHKQGREVLLEQLVINNLKVAKNGLKYVNYYYYGYFSLEIWQRSILTLRRWRLR